MSVFALPGSIVDADFPVLAIFNSIFKDRDPSLGHLGVVYNIPDSEGMSFLHLEGPKSLSQRPPKYYWGWAAPKLNATTSRLLAERIHNIGNEQLRQRVHFRFGAKHGGVFLGFDVTSFTPNLPPGCLGLSCVTYVLNLFSHHGISLIDLSDWPGHRTEDDRWFAGACEMVERFAPENLDAFKAEWPTSWIRPTEVIGAVLTQTHPVGHRQVQAKDREVLDLWRSFLSSEQGLKLYWTVDSEGDAKAQGISHSYAIKKSRSDPAKWDMLVSGKSKVTKRGLSLDSAKSECDQIERLEIEAQ